MNHLSIPPLTHCELAGSAEARDQVYRIRYECYHRSGAIAFDPTGRFLDAYDQLPNHFSFLAVNDEYGPMATVRISVVRPGVPGWETSPGAHVFGDHPAFAELARGSYVEASRLCFRAQARRDALCQLVAHLAALAEIHGAEWLVACPRVEHSGIYQRVFGFKPLAAPRQYYGVNFQTELLAVPLNEMRGLAGTVKSMARAWDEARTLAA